MSVVPPEIPDVGATSQRLRQNPKFDPLRAGFGTEEYFVWSRFDGATTVKDLILMTGLAIDRAVAIVRQLRRAGAILAPGETPESIRVGDTRSPTQPMRAATAPGTNPPAAPGTNPPGGRVPTAPSVSRLSRPNLGGNAQTQPVPVWSSSAATESKVVTAALPLPPLDNPTAEERAMNAEPGDFSAEERARVLVGLRLVAAGDLWALLGVPPGADKRVIKRAFFERSKLFHPDRFYGRKLGPWQARINTVFEAISAAHAELIDPRAVRSEDAAATAPQTPAEYAGELFDRACVAEVSGDLAAAVKLFAAAVKLDPIARYLRRAASCALAAGELQAALDHARKATALDPTDPSIARTLARVLRAQDKLDDAEEVLLMALAMKNENDTLGNELRADLAAVRAALARRG